MEVAHANMGVEVMSTKDLNNHCNKGKLSMKSLKPHVCPSTCLHNSDFWSISWLPDFPIYITATAEHLFKTNKRKPAVTLERHISSKNLALQLDREGEKSDLHLWQLEKCHQNGARDHLAPQSLAVTQTGWFQHHFAENYFYHGCNKNISIMVYFQE
jgi:hypothetical protein